MTPQHDKKATMGDAHPPSIILIPMPSDALHTLSAQQSKQNAQNSFIIMGRWCFTPKRRKYSQIQRQCTAA
jgi:hypothetical protein